MSYKVSFLDNEQYGALDLNNTVKRLVTGGVADVFANGVPYNCTKINNVVKTIAASGVVPDNVNTLKVSKLSEGQIRINDGTAFFDSGAVIEVSGGGETLSYQAGVKNYVYLKADLASNVVRPYCTVAAPTGDFVPLAEIDATGNITDKRKYATGKMTGYQKSIYYETITHPAGTTKTYNLINKDFTYVIIDMRVINTNTTYQTNLCFYGYYKRGSGFSGFSELYAGSPLYIRYNATPKVEGGGTHGTYLEFEEQNGQLTVKAAPGFTSGTMTLVVV